MRKGSNGSAVDTNKDMTGTRTGSARFVPPGRFHQHISVTHQLPIECVMKLDELVTTCELNNFGNSFLDLAFPIHNLADGSWLYLKTQKER